MKVLNYPNYLVFRNGKVLNLKRKIFMKPQLKTTGYYYYGFWDGKGNRKNIQLHVLLAIHFIPNLDKKLMVDHIDRNPKNNNLNNLRWVTHTENMSNKNYDEYSVRSSNQLKQKNIHYSNTHKRYIFKMIRDKKTIHQKYFKTLEEAISFRDNIS